ncbi:MAG: sel1 repeat family protein [Legionellales bacterium]|nr:sel1 repeat family protein [Legionellales bacterium]
MKWMLNNFTLLFYILLATLAGCTTPKHNYGTVPTQKTDIAAYNPSTYGYAYSYFEQRAEKGDPIAEDNLGRMYADGRGVAENPEQSVKWYAKAAAKHNADAELNLGVATLYGRGIAQNTGQACQLFSSAKHDGNRYAEEFYSVNCTHSSVV